MLARGEQCLLAGNRINAQGAIIAFALKNNTRLAAGVDFHLPNEREYGACRTESRWRSAQCGSPVLLYTSTSPASFAPPLASGGVRRGRRSVQALFWRLRHVVRVRTLRVFPDRSPYAFPEVRLFSHGSRATIKSLFGHRLDIGRQYLDVLAARPVIRANQVMRET